MDNLRSLTLSSLSWSGFSQIIRQILRFSISVVLARILTPQEFGLIGMIVVFTGFADLFNDMGLTAALVQKIDLEERHLNCVFWVNIATGILLTAIVAAAAPLIASFYNKPVLRLITIVIAFNFSIGSLKMVQSALFHKKMQFKRLAHIEIVSVFISGIATISLALAGFGVWSLVFQSLLMTLISVCMMWYLSDWRPSFSWNPVALKELLSFSLNLLGFRFFNYWIRNFDNLLIGKFVGSLALGIYSRAYGLMLLPVSQISNVVTRVMFPVLSKIQNDTERVKRIYLRSTRIIALVTFPLMVGLFVVARPFILTVYGDKWVEVIPILQIFCFTGMIQSIGTTVGWIYTSQGRTDIMLKWGLCAGIVTVIAFIIGLRWGIIGVALAYVLSNYIILWYPSWAISGRLINLRFTEMLKNLSKTFFCAVAMGAGVWILGFTLPSDWPHWSYLVIQMPFGILMYFVLISVFKLSAYLDLRELISEQWQLKFNKKMVSA